jgi:hypothetical protein
MEGLNRNKNRLTKRHSMKRNHSHVLRKLALAFAIVLVAIAAYTKVQPYTADAKLERQLESTQHQLRQTRKALQETKVNSEQQFVEQVKKVEEINKKLQETEAQLQAKRNAQTAYAASLDNGSCADWMRMAGIPLTYATNKLIINESGCRTNAINPESGACGIPQSLPCSKMNCPLNNQGAVCQLRWMDQYVKGRYGSWENALAMWYSRSPHWY